MHKYRRDLEAIIEKPSVFRSDNNNYKLKKVVPCYYKNNMQNQVYYNNVEMAQEQASENAQRVARPRRVRTSFTSFQLNKMEETFKKGQFISRPVRYILSLELNLQEKQIKIWFQNRRMKEKKENVRVAASIATAINSPPMLDQNLVYQNNLTQMPSTSWYNPNSSTMMNENLVYQGNVQQYPALNYPHQQISQNISLPGPSSSYNSSPIDQSAPSSYDSNSPPLNQSAYQFDESSHFLTPIYKNQECTEQYQTLNEVSPVEDKTSNQEQTFSDKINFYEIQQMFGDIY